MDWKPLQKYVAILMNKWLFMALWEEFCVLIRPDKPLLRYLRSVRNVKHQKKPVGKNGESSQSHEDISNSDWTIPNQSQSTKPKAESDSKWKDRIPAITAILQTVILGVMVWTNVLYTFHWTEFKRQADAASNQVIVAASQLKETREQDMAEREAARQQLAIMQSNSIIEQRAWLGFASTFSLMHPYDGEHNIGIQTTVINTGKTPGMVESVHLSVGTINDPFVGTNWTTNWFLEKDFRGFTVPPNGINPLNFSEQSPIGVGNFELLLNKRQAHIFCIKIRYRDVFGKIRFLN
jgi:hypothetical protein